MWSSPMLSSATNTRLASEDNDLNFFKINLWKYDNDNNSVAIMPFFHLNKESFYHIKWKEGKEITSYSRTPSAKYLRENVEYAKLDDELWHILQDSSNREIIKQAIINKYFPEK